MTNHVLASQHWKVNDLWQDILALFKNQTFLLVLLFALNFASSISLLLAPMDSEADAYSRYMNSVGSLRDGNIFYVNGGVWLPLQQTFLTASAFLFPHSLLAPRIQTVVVSSLIPVLLFLLTKIATKQSIVSFGTAVLFIVWPLFREIGTATLTEPIFLFLFLAGLYGLVTKRFLTFGIFFLLSQMTRFEAWFMIPWFAAIVVFQKEVQFRMKVLLLGLMIVFPLWYSLIGHFNGGNYAAYYSDKATMVVGVSLPGENNFPLAIAAWNEKMWRVFPVSFAGFFLVGLYTFLKQKTQTMPADQLGQLSFAILPLFLLFMLAVPVFLNLDDWFPSRYLLIPLTCAFPLIGVGCQFIWTHVKWRIFWQWYVFGAVFLFFELYSLQLNTHGLIAHVPRANFLEVIEDLNQLKPTLSLTQSTQLYVVISQLRMPTADFFNYFLLSYQVSAEEVSLAELAEKLPTSKAQKNIVVTANLEKLPPDLQLQPLVSSAHFAFLEPVAVTP